MFLKVEKQVLLPTVPTSNNSMLSLSVLQLQKHFRLCLQLWCDHRRIAKSWNTFQTGQWELSHQCFHPQSADNFLGFACQAWSTLSWLNGNTTFFHYFPKIFKFFSQKCLRQKMAMIIFLPYNLKKTQKNVLGKSFPWVKKFGGKTPSTHMCVGQFGQNTPVTHMCVDHCLGWNLWWGIGERIKWVHTAWWMDDRVSGQQFLSGHFFKDLSDYILFVKQENSWLMAFHCCHVIMWLVHGSHHPWEGRKAAKKPA